MTQKMTKINARIPSEDWARLNEKIGKQRGARSKFMRLAILRLLDETEQDQAA